MEITLKKSDILKPLIIGSGYGFVDNGQLVLRLEEVSSMVSHPDPNNLKLVKELEYKATLYTQNLNNSPSPFSVNAISMNDKNLNFSITGKRFVNFVFKKEDIGDITINWTDINE